MKPLTFAMVLLALLALIVGQVGASPASLLKADLDGDNDMELVTAWNSPDPNPPLARMTDLDKDGDVDLIETRGMPDRLCNLDNDTMFEAVVQDGNMTSPWTTAVMGNRGQPALVFVRGTVHGCVIDPQTKGIVLLVNDPAYSGTADIDGDGIPEIRWAPQSINPASADS